MPSPTDDDPAARARRLAAELAPGAADRDRQRRFPADELGRLGASGLLALGVPVPLGGLPADRSAVVGVVREIAAADASIAQLLIVHLGLVELLRSEADDAQLGRFAAAIVAGTRLGNAAAERGTAHALRISTVLARDPDGVLRLDGVKHYATGARDAGLIAVVARRPDGSGATAFVPGDAPGLEVRDNWDGFGQRTTASGEVRLDAVAVDPCNVLGTSPTDAPRLVGAFGQLLHAAVDAGIAEGALRDVSRHLRERGRPWVDADVPRLVDEPHVRHRIGELAIRVRAADALVSTAAAAFEARQPLASVRARPGSGSDLDELRVAVASAKAFAAEAAVGVSSDVLALAGGSAASEVLGLDRHWRDARTHTLHDPVRWKYHHIGAHRLGTPLPPPSSVL